MSFGGGSPIDTVKNAAWQLMGGRAGSRTIDFAGAATTPGSGGEILHIEIPTTLSAGELIVFGVSKPYERVDFPRRIPSEP